MKVRNGFVSNSSSSSFVIESKYSDDIPDGRSITFKEYCDDYLLENMIDWGLPEDIRQVKICSDDEFINEFTNYSGSLYRVPRCAEDEFEEFKIADKTYSSDRKRYQEARDKLVNKVYELLKPKFDNLELYEFDASDHDHTYADDEDSDINDEDYFRDIVYGMSGFTKIFNRH